MDNADKLSHVPAPGSFDKKPGKDDTKSNRTLTPLMNVHPLQPQAGLQQAKAPPWILFYTANPHLEPEKIIALLADRYSRDGFRICIIDTCMERSSMAGKSLDDALQRYFLLRPGYTMAGAILDWETVVANRILGRQPSCYPDIFTALQPIGRNVWYLAGSAAGKMPDSIASLYNHFEGRNFIAALRQLSAGKYDYVLVNAEKGPISHPQFSSQEHLVQHKDHILPAVHAADIILACDDSAARQSYTIICEMSAHLETKGFRNPALIRPLQAGLDANTTIYEVARILRETFSSR